MPFCGEASLIAEDGNVLQATPLRCKRWSCPDCAPMRRARLIAEGRTGQPNTFLTLTVRPRSGETPDARACRLAAAWRLIRRRACKRYGYKSVPFLCVFEQTKRGEPHLHVLCRTVWLDQKWLSDQMSELMDAPVVDIRRVRSLAAAVNYVSKYCTKDAHKFEGTKRYWRSQDWFVATDRCTDFVTYRPLIWTRHEWSVDEVVAALEKRGYCVNWEHETAWLEPPPEDGRFRDHIAQWL